MVSMLAIGCSAIVVENFPEREPESNPVEFRKADDPVPTVHPRI
jgi:hypothetical protein